IVTGAAQGLGRGIAHLLAQEGAAVVAADVQEAGAQRTAEEIKESGGKSIGVKADVSLPGDVARMVAAAVREFSTVSILINNAGIFPRVSLLEMTINDWDQVMNVNLKGVFLCSKEAGRVMVEARKGSIVNISSGAAFRGSPRGVHYSASKGGVLSFTRTLAIEWAPYRIRVNCIAPGTADTAQPRVVMSEEEMQRAGSMVPLGRIAQPIDIAKATLFLVSSDAEHITGQTLHVNGGSYLW
ncbi:MAG: SDR family oxidoreductase, partial [Candidatus Tectomicrobia bacterium]|nr:SDR family oxidoreductase [Candidatus Tectomicrobia bacterium]